MNAAAVLAICAAAIQLVMGLLLLRLASAPGWRSARTLAAIALTAGAVSTTNIYFAVPGLSDQALHLAARINYAMASLHVAAWLLYSFGGASSSMRELSRRLRVVVYVLVTVGIWILLTGTHVGAGQWADTNIQWAHVQYHAPVLRSWAEWYSAFLIVVLAIVFVEFIKRARAGVQGAIAHLVGFTIFFACAVLEVLITNGIVSTLFLADLGFLAVVLPLGSATVRRVVTDAGRLEELSRRLSHEIKEQSVALDQVQVALQESQRDAALGRLAAGVAHEINNPLTYVRLNLDLVDEWAAHEQLPADILESLASASDGTERIRRVVEGLRSHTRNAVGEWRQLSPATLVQSAMDFAGHQLQGVRLESVCSARQMVRGDEARLVQVLVSLLTNSAQAIAEAQLSGPVSITVRTTDLSSERVAIDVVDTGPGIRPEILRCLTTANFTTRADSGGMGLGLFLAREIIEQHGGSLDITSVVGSGTTARIQLLVATADDVEPEESSLSLFALHG